jgi:acylpyruvate hydrolase
VRLATIEARAGTSAAVVRDGYALPVDGYTDVGALLADGERGRELALAASDGDPLERMRLRTPVPTPRAVFCVGLNYATHISEMGRERPEYPTIFAKVAQTLADPYADIELPSVSTQVDYEGELVVVVGRRARAISPEEARGAIAGYALMNDVSMRDWQYRTVEWCAGKNFERSAPTGPWLVTADEFDVAGSELVVEVNGEERQRARFDDLVFAPHELLSYVSQFTTLVPGDLIATGTPGGVGHAMEPPHYLAAGDVVRVRVSGLGELENRFAA